LFSKLFRRKKSDLASAIWDEKKALRERTAQEEKRLEEIRRAAFDGWLSHAIGTSLADNPLPDLSEVVCDGIDKIALVGELKEMHSTLDSEVLADVVKETIKEKLVMIAQIRASLAPLERSLKELLFDHEALENGEYVRWLAPEPDLLDYNPDTVRDLLERSPHRREDEDAAA
jgi:hypothetical protein